MALPGVRPTEPVVENAIPLLAFQFINLVLIQVFTVVLINAIEVTRGRAFLTAPQCGAFMDATRVCCYAARVVTRGRAPDRAPGPPPCRDAVRLFMDAVRLFMDAVRLFMDA
eukprot:1998306-Rhodomonas_salina.1